MVVLLAECQWFCQGFERTGLTGIKIFPRSKNVRTGRLNDVVKSLPWVSSRLCLSTWAGCISGSKKNSTIFSKNKMVRPRDPVLTTHYEYVEIIKNRSGWWIISCNYCIEQFEGRDNRTYTHLIRECTAATKTVKQSAKAPLLANLGVQKNSTPLTPHPTPPLPRLAGSIDSFLQPQAIHYRSNFKGIMRTPWLSSDCGWD